MAHIVDPSHVAALCGTNLTSYSSHHAYAIDITSITHRCCELIAGRNFEKFSSEFTLRRQKVAEMRSELGLTQEIVHGDQLGVYGTWGTRGVHRLY